MAKELHKCLINYFSHLEKADCKWKQGAEQATRILQALGNQSQQLRLVKSNEVRDAELYAIDEVYERLMFKILMGIDSEFIQLYNILTRFNNTNEDLRNRLKNLEDARSKVSLDDETMKELVNGTAERPRLNLLLEWAIYAVNYYHGLYLAIKASIKKFNYEDAETVEDIIKSFVEDRFKRERIDRILAFTQFLREETDPSPSKKDKKFPNKNNSNNDDK